MAATAPATPTDPSTVLFIPIHANFSQVEHTIEFVTQYRTRLFLYSFLPTSGREALERFYNGLGLGDACTLHEFSVEAVMRELAAIWPARAVVLLTASPNYEFGRFQLALFTKLRTLVGGAIKDVYGVGHCVYGCESCATGAHAKTTFFSRFARGALPLRADAIVASFSRIRPAVGADALRRVLLSPSYGTTSILSNPIVAEALVTAANRLDTLAVLAKFHGVVYAGRAHPLFQLSPIELETAALLQRSFVVASEADYNILPFMQASHAMITDLNSSVPFEGLFFDHLVVLAYLPPPPYQPRPDPEFHARLHLFSTADELVVLLARLARGELAPCGGRAFFEAMKGRISGNEAAEIALERGWAADPAATASSGSGKGEAAAWPAATVTVDSLLAELAPTPEERTSVAYAALGATVPDEMDEYVGWLVQHQVQLEAAGVPMALWRQVYVKVTNEIFDAGETFALGRYADGSGWLVQCVAEPGLEPASGVWLIDHAWSTTAAGARDSLLANESLQLRLAAMLPPLAAELDASADAGADAGAAAAAPVPGAALVESLVTRMWARLNTYTMRSSSGAAQSVWYAMDELGSALEHETGTPAVAVVPFLSVSTGAAFSLMYPLRRIEPGESVTRDYCPKTAKDSVAHAANLLAWFPLDELAAADDIVAAGERHRADGAARAAAYVAPERSDAVAPSQPFGHLETGLVVCTPLAPVREHMAHPAIDRFVETGWQDADLTWLATDFPFFALLRPWQRVNQFPHETCVTMKHRLAQLVWAVRGSGAAWLPDTYDLETQMAEFAADFVRREQRGEDNTWIVKAYNLARSEEMFVSQSLAQILRSAEAIPRIVCKYIASPATFQGRKFDLRYIVAVRSFEPLEAYVYDMFWTRLANRPFELARFDDYETHFTVMNYTPHGLTQLPYREFVALWDSELYPAHPWYAGVQPRVLAAFREVFEAAAAVPPPIGLRGHGGNGCCAAMYGIDVMFEVTPDGIQPKVLEVNFAPDCTRAVMPIYSPSFFSDLFAVMYMPRDENPDAWARVTRL